MEILGVIPIASLQLSWSSEKASQHQLKHFRNSNFTVRTIIGPGLFSQRFRNPMPCLGLGFYAMFFFGTPSESYAMLAHVVLQSASFPNWAFPNIDRLILNCISKYRHRRQQQPSGNGMRIHLSIESQMVPPRTLITHHPQAQPSSRTPTTHH
jgi:hypothetical protein